ncbi:MAG: D-alanyl-D-alanine carboxypeptidase/D-alanyl-D-alanine-endopeptidase [Burkholderiales bacterium]
MPARRRVLQRLAQGSLAAACPATLLAAPRRTLPDPSALLPEALRSRLAGSGLPLDSFGLSAVAIDTGAPVLALHAQQPYVLASTAKVVTALAALDLLGPRYRWRTRAYLLGPLVDGVLHGDLLIVGGGDVQLSTEQLRTWFTAMQAQGLREVRGDLRLDRSAFHLVDADYASTPIPAPERPHHVRPDALSLDGGVVRVAVQPARGARALVSVTPPLANVRIVNGVGMQGGCNASALFRPQHGRPELQVSGSWSAACGAREFEFAPLAAEEMTLRALGEVWRESGGRLRGAVLDRPVPTTQDGLPAGPDGVSVPLYAVHSSEPLATLVRAMNKQSQNVMARHLMLSLAPGFPWRPATPAAAQARLRLWLARQGLAPDDVVLDNGSGLSRAERAKPAAMVQLLRGVWGTRNSQIFFDSLPIAGVDGTLAHRLSQPSVHGQAFLKTGTLLDTRALAGYVHGRSGRWYAVAMMANHPNAAQATPALDGVIDWLAKL